MLWDSGWNLQCRQHVNETHEEEHGIFGNRGRELDHSVGVHDHAHSK